MSKLPQLSRDVHHAGQRLLIYEVDEPRSWSGKLIYDKATEVTVLEWSPSGKLVKLRFETYAGQPVEWLDMNINWRYVGEILFHPEEVQLYSGKIDVLLSDSQRADILVQDGKIVGVQRTS